MAQQVQPSKAQGTAAISIPNKISKVNITFSNGQHGVRQNSLITMQAATNTNQSSTGKTSAERTSLLASSIN